MNHLVRDYLNRRRFRRTKARAQDRMVCAAMGKDGKPLYFTMPRDAEDHEIQDRAFEVREGRQLSPGERTLLAMAHRRMKQDA